MATTTACTVRAARADEAEALAGLATQLGYPTSAGEMAERLTVVADSRDAAVLVAADAEDRPIGWIHAEIKASLLAPRAAQVMGLVVDEGRRGVGAELLERAEAWAVERGCAALLVATRVTREGAHRFYRRQGYELLKTSHIFGKDLV